MFNKSKKDSSYFCCLCISKDKSVKICTFLLMLWYICLTLYTAIFYGFYLKFLYAIIYIITVISLCILLMGIKKRDEKYINIFIKTFSFSYGFSIAVILYDLSNRFLSIFTAGNTDEINNFRIQHSNFTFIKNYTDNEITKTIRYLSLVAITVYALCIFILSDYFFVTYNYAKRLIDSINGEREFKLLEEDTAWE